MAIPTTNRLPFTFIEFDPSKAQRGPAILKYRLIMTGQKLASGTKAANVPVLVTSAAEAAQFFGIGSMLANMFTAWFANNKTTQIYGLPLADEGGAVAATSATLPFTGPATAAGTLYLYIGGVRLTVAVASGDTATTIGAAVAAAINAKTSLPVTANAVTGTVSLTARNAGPQGNDIDVRFNYNEGEFFPTGVACTIAPLASGATAPSLTTALASMGDTWYNILIGPYNDATSLTAIETELADRFGAIRQIDCHYFTARKGNLSSQTTFGNGRNSPHVTCFDAEGCPTTPWENVAGKVGQIAASVEADPALPVHTLPVYGALPPAPSARRPYADNNALLFDGISPFAVDQAGMVRLSTVITMYQRNGAGAEDTSYLFYNTMATLAYLRYSFKTRIQTKYARAKLANDDAEVPSGQTILRPKDGYAEAIAWFKDMQALGLVENLEQFKRDLIVQRNTSDVNRMDWILPPDMMNMYITGAVNMQFLN
jgi:phage tail sheath gpL-like